MPYFHVVGLDYPDQPERRQAARAEHLSVAEKLAVDGKLLHAGALLGDTGAMVGSVLVYKVTDRAELDGILAAEPYVAQKVFRTVEITPYKPAPFLAV